MCVMCHNISYNDVNSVGAFEFYVSAADRTIFFYKQNMFIHIKNIFVCNTSDCRFMSKI